MKKLIPLIACLGVIIVVLFMWLRNPDYTFEEYNGVNIYSFDKEIKYEDIDLASNEYILDNVVIYSGYIICSPTLVLFNNDGEIVTGYLDSLNFEKRYMKQILKVLNEISPEEELYNYE